MSTSQLSALQSGESIRVDPQSLIPARPHAPSPLHAGHVTPSLSPCPPRGCYQGVLQLWVRVM